MPVFPTFSNIKPEKMLHAIINGIELHQGPTGKFKRHYTWGAWVAQSVKCPTLDFGSGHDLTVHEFQPCIRLCVDGVESALESLSFSLTGRKLYKRKMLLLEKQI